MLVKIWAVFATTLIWAVASGGTQTRSFIDPGVSGGWVEARR